MQRARAVIAPPSKGLAVRSAFGAANSSHALPARQFAIIATRSSARPVQRSLLSSSSSSSSLLPLRFHLSLRHFHASRHIQQSAAAPEAVEEKDPSSVDGTHPDQVARAILSHLRDAAPQSDAAKRNARLRSLLRDLKPGEGVGRALLAVSRDLGLRRTGRLLPLLYSSQEKGSINRLTHLLLTLAHGHVQQGDKEPKDLIKALGQLTNGVVETWEAEDVTKLLRIIPRSSYFSLAEGKEYPPGSMEWSPRELGGLVGQLKHERAERRDLEFFMDVLVKLLTSPEREGGWGREKSVAPAEATSTASPATTTQRKDLPKSSKPTVVYDLDYVPKVVGPALAPFFDYWGNQDYATVIQCLITAFSQHAVTTYGQQTLTKEQYHDFCLEMMAQTAISSKPTVGMLHYMVNDITSGWEEHEVDALSTRLEARMKPHGFFRRWFRKLFNQATPN